MKLSIPDWVPAVKGRGNKAKVNPDEEKGTTSASSVLTQGRSVTWWTPWSWVSSQGVYVGDDGAWVYRQLPMGILDDEGLAALFTAGKELGTDRDIHLLLHAWSSPIEPGTFNTTGTGLDDYLTDTLRLRVPVRRLLLGVKLHAQKRKMSFLENVYKGVDEVLAEDVPDLDVYDADLAAVDSWLSRFSAQPMDAVATGQLESWYLLGHESDIPGQEEDTFIRLSDESSLSFATANPDPASKKFPPAPPAPPGSDAAVCASARGELLTSSKEELGLRNVSVVLGRRAIAEPSWESRLRDVMPAANPCGLPLRQLPGLDETLPASRSRVNPQESPVTPAILAQAGFMNPAPIGDHTGVFLGMGGVGYTDPTLLNPLGNPEHPIWIVGGEVAGKTFLAEHIAYQCTLAGITVRYLSGDADAGRVLITDGAQAFTQAVPGMLDPGRLPQEFTRWRAAALAGLSSATPQVDPTVFERAAKHTSSVSTVDPDLLPSLRDTLAITLDPKSTASLRRASTAQGSLAWASLKPGEAVPLATAAWSMPHLLQDFIEEYGTREAAQELLMCAALTLPPPPGSPGVVVIVDGITPGPLVAEALKACARTNRPVGLLVASRTAPPPPRRGITLFGSDVDPTALQTLVGPAIMNQQRAGKRHFAVISSDSTIRSATTMTMIDAQGRMAPLVIAPVNASVLPEIGRDSGLHYSP